MDHSLTAPRGDIAVTRPSVAQIGVGRRLRARRERDGLTLRELARRLEASPSAISQVETGKSLPSVGRLYAIAAELGMSLDELFETEVPTPASQAANAKDGRSSDGREQQPACRKGRVERAGTREAFELGSGVRGERVTADAEPILDFLYVVYEAGGASTQGDQFIRHSGREHGLILSGQLEVAVGFDSYLLGPGDSISFDATFPHRLRNLGNEPVTGVWLVIDHQGDHRVAQTQAGERV